MVNLPTPPTKQKVKFQFSSNKEKIDLYYNIELLFFIKKLLYKK